MDFAENKQQQEQVKKTRLNLGGGQSHEFGLHVENDNMGMFDDKEKMSKSSLRSKATEYDNTLKTQLSEGANFATRRATETAMFHVASARLCKDSVWFRFSDSPEMTRVKKTVNFLNNMLDLKLEKYVTEIGGRKTFDTGKLKEELDTAFDEAHNACVNYIDKKDSAGKAKKRHGIRRRQKVWDMMRMIEEEKPKYDQLIEAIKMESLTENSVEANMLKSPRELSTKFKSSVTKNLEAQWQNEGNSTDVYRVVITEDGKDKTYFLKRNLPLISADIGGFLTRRKEQLTTSKKRHDSQKEDEKKLEENRLSKAGMEAPDYDNAIGFLDALMSKRKNASVADRVKVENTIIAMFRHDFDRMFNELQAYNAAVDYAISNSDIDWNVIAAKDGDPRQQMAMLIVKIRGEQAVAAGGKAEEVQLQKKDALTWMKEKLEEDLNIEKDADIIQKLADIHEKDTEHGLENLFRVMLGKEVELFGQMRDRGKGDEREQSAANNSGFYRIAEIADLTEVVTASDIRIVRFTDRDGKVVEDFCTVTEEAEGEELLSLLKEAESSHKRVDYSPAAIRQLMQLQALDTVTRQVDRHGRNLKCLARKLNGRIVIDSIKSYDQDMSFAEETLKDTFKVNPDGSLDFQGFLPPMTTKIKKDSAFFKYLKYERFGMQPDFIKNIEVPRLRHCYYKSSTVRGRQGSTSDFCYPFLKHKEFADPDLKITHDQNTRDDKENLHGRVYRIPKPADDETKETQAAYEKKKEKFERVMTQDHVYLPGEEAEEFRVKGEELDKVTGKLGTLISDIRKLVIRGDSKEDEAERKRLSKEYKEKHTIGNIPAYLREFKTDYTDEEKKKLCKLVYELKDMYETYDFRFVAHGFQVMLENGSEAIGRLDLWMQQFMYFFANAFKEDIIVNDELMKLENKADEKARKEALFKSLQDENGDITLPTYLHYDLKAYEGLKRLASDDTLDLMRLKLKALDFNEKKILMNKLRAQEMLEQIEEARKKALIFYQLMGWTEHPQCDFFLKEEDYKKFNDINELAVDPGKTYLSIDNQNYMYGVKEYAKYVSENEFARAFKSEEKKRHDPKRWNDLEFGIHAKDKYDYSQTMRWNVVRGKIDNTENGQDDNKK